MASSQTADAQSSLRRSSIGPHLGVNFDIQEPFLGIGSRIGVAEITPTVLVQLNPTASYYFIENDNVTLLNFSFNVPFEFVIQGSVLRPYTAPGLGIWWALVDDPGDNDVDLTFNILGGLLFALGSVEPFVELRVILGNGSSAELVGGCLFVL